MRSAFAIFLSVVLLLIILLFSTGIYFRSTVVGVSYAYFPNHTDVYFPKIYNFFKKIKIPFNAELNKIEISNFENREKFLATIPLGRFSKPDDIANAAVFLSSDESNFLTGVCLDVDGGRSI